MRVLQELWTWARKRAHCDGENPFAGFHNRLRRGVNVDPYVAWEIDELRRLFDPPPGRNDLTEIMIVAMFTGMRLDEIASLTWGKLRTSEEDGQHITFFQVEDAKTPAGNRQVPLHEQLSWLAERERGGADKRIWPKFNDEGVGKKPGADAGREFSTFKLKRGFNERRKAFHSFRKNVTRIMERAKVPQNEWALVFGHERGFTYSVYNPDGITLAHKAEIISHISCPGLDIPHPPTGS
jgi:integrase